MVLGSGGPERNVAVIDMQEHDVVDVQERPSSGPLKSLISGVREWITIVGSYEPQSGLGSRMREIDAQYYRDQVRLHWPDGVRVNGLSDAAERARRN